MHHVKDEWYNPSWQRLYYLKPILLKAAEYPAQLHQDVWGFAACDHQGNQAAIFFKAKNAFAVARTKGMQLQWMQ